MKKGTLIISGILAIAGITAAVTGAALGGRPGSITVKNAQFVFENSKESFAILDVPNGWSSYFAYLPKPPKPPKLPVFTNSNAAIQETLIEDSDTNGVYSPDNLQNIAKLSIEIPVGNLTIKYGETPNLEVDGPIEYTSTMNSDEWQVQSKEQNNRNFISTQKGSDGRTHYYRNSEDITTNVVLTLPDNSLYLDIELGMGVLNIDGINLNTLYISSGAGKVTVKNCTASEVSFESATGSMDLTNISATDLSIETATGNVKAQNISTQTCDIEVATGKVDFAGTTTAALDIGVGAGVVNVSMPRPARYYWNASIGAGKITIDGQNVTSIIGGEAIGGTEGALPEIYLEVGFGVVDISFE